MKAILAQQAAKGSLLSGSTLIQLSQLAEGEIKQRATLAVKVGRQVLANESLETLDTAAMHLMQLIDTSIASTYSEAWAAITEPPTIKELDRTNARAVQQVQWQVSQVRNEQQDWAASDMDLCVRELRGRPATFLPRKKRRLAAIVAVDIAGYSASTENDEAKTIDEVMTLRSTIQTIAKTHDGRIFNTAGDGFMLEFNACTAALHAADDLAKNCKPKVRVGVHVGDVAEIDGGDLLGHAVNVAARIMQLSTPGVATISDDVRRMMRDPIVTRLHARGQAQLEKMADVMDIFELLPDRK